MGRVSGFVIFVSVVLLVLVGLHTYLWLRLVRDPQLPPVWRSIATAALVLAGASVPAAFLLRRASPATAGWSWNWIAWPAYTWIGLMFLLVVVLAGIDLLRVAYSLLARVTGAEVANADRRTFLSRWLAGGALMTASGLGVVAVRSALGPVAVRRVEIPLSRLARTQDGITLVQLTDLHVGPTIGRRHIADIVKRTNALQPDVVAITGDLVDGSVAELRDSVAPLADLRAKHGVFFVTGNHEYFSGAAAWVREISRLGIRVLRNERVTIGDEGGSFDLAGVDDRSAARFPTEGHGEDLGEALRGRDPKRLVVLLAHQPRTVIDAARLGVDLQLSGHTHGGQIWPFGALVRLQQQFLAGLGRQGDTIIYVSRGTGYWGPPMRLFAPAEISQIVLRVAAARSSARSSA
jgi:predicted MPP superfamily phosphohydrolase